MNTIALSGALKPNAISIEALSDLSDRRRE
jgi:hypothetical protein